MISLQKQGMSLPAGGAKQQRISAPSWTRQLIKERQLMKRMLEKQTSKEKLWNTQKGQEKQCPTTQPRRNTSKHPTNQPASKHPKFPTAPQPTPQMTILVIRLMISMISTTGDGRRKVLRRAVPFPHSVRLVSFPFGWPQLLQFPVQVFEFCFRLLNSLFLHVHDGR